MTVQRYHELLDAGYKPSQILTCPWGDPCPCEAKGPQKACGMAQPNWPTCNMGFAHPPHTQQHCEGLSK